MSWQLKIINLDKAAKIKDLLEDDWEPFALHDTTVVVNDEERFVTKLILKKSSLDNSDIDAFVEHAGHIEHIYTEGLDAIASKLDTLIRSVNKLSVITLTKSSGRLLYPTNEDEDGEVDNDELKPVGRNEDEDYLDDQGQKVEHPEDILVVDPAPAPFSEEDLDESRHVESTGEETDDEDFSPTHKMTAKQDKAIKEIRKKEKVNLTVSAVREDGSVKVMARSRVYVITSDGEYEFTSSKAKTGMNAEA